MNWIAWKMLTGDRAKYFGIVFGVAFGSLLISHQTSIFVSVLRRTASQIIGVADADIWVMNARTQSIDDVRPLNDHDLTWVRGVPGVEWAVKFYKGPVVAGRPNGHYGRMLLLGLADWTLVGHRAKCCRDSFPTCAAPTRSSSTSPGMNTCFRASRLS